MNQPKIIVWVIFLVLLFSSNCWSQNRDRIFNNLIKLINQNERHWKLDRSDYLYLNDPKATVFNESFYQTWRFKDRSISIILEDLPTAEEALKEYRNFEKTGFSGLSHDLSNEIQERKIKDLPPQSCVIRTKAMYFYYYFKVGFQQNRIVVILDAPTEYLAKQVAKYVFQAIRTSGRS